MKIYVGHPTDFDFEEELYRPLKESSIAEEHELVFPHDSGDFFESKRFLRDECDLFVAEVSRASTGLGIELGWAEEFGVPVLCVYREGAEPSSAVGTVTSEIRVYSDVEELTRVVRDKSRSISSG